MDKPERVVFVHCVCLTRSTLAFNSKHHQERPNQRSTHFHTENQTPLHACTHTHHTRTHEHTHTHTHKRTRTSTCTHKYTIVRGLHDSWSDSPPCHLRIHAHAHTHTRYYQMLARELQRIDAYDQAGQSEIDKPCYYMRNEGICPVCWFLLVSLFFVPSSFPIDSSTSVSFPSTLLRCLPYSAAPPPSSIPQPLAHPVTECKSVYCARAVWCQLYTLTRPQDAVSQDKRVQDVQDQNVFCFSEQGNSFACTCECVCERAQYIYIHIHTHDT